MKTINKKGFTVIELILSFSFVMIISLGMFSILTSYRESQLMISLDSDMKSFQNNITTVIQNDITDDVLEKAEYCSGPMGNNPDCVVLYFKNGAAKKLEIKTAQYTDEDGNDFEGKYISYDGIIYEPKEQQFVNFKPDFILEWTPIDTNLTIYKFNIPVFHEDLDGNYGLKITATGINRKEESQTLDKCFSITTSGVVTVFQRDDPNCAVTDLVIPPTINGIVVKGIASWLFQGLKLTSVSIPSSVEYIGINAFRHNKLTSLTLPNSLTSIGSYAFSLNQLSSVTIPDSVTSIESYAFEHNQLTSLTLPNSLTSIEAGVFSQNQLSSVTIPDSVTSIGSYAFETNRLSNVTIPDSVTSIGIFAFRMNRLTSLTLPNSLTSIEDGVFDLNRLSNVTIPDSVTSIGSYAFEDNRLSNVTIPDSVTSIGISAFSMNQLSNVTIPNSVTSIGDNAFWQNQLSSVTIPDSVTSIGISAFETNHLTSLTLPNSLNSIGNYAFADNPLGIITMQGRENTTGMTLGTYWNGSGTIVFEP